MRSVIHCVGIVVVVFFSYSSIFALTQYSTSKEAQVRVYPNPFRDKFVLELNPVSPAIVHFELAGLDGKILLSWSKPLDKGTQQITLMNLPAFPAGVYILRVSLPDRVEVIKILKE